MVPGRSVTKAISPYKMSAAGENFVISERYKGILPATKEILPYKISAAGAIFTVSERY